MGSPLAPIIADIFITDLEQKLMKRLRKKGVLWYKRFVDDTFVIVRKFANLNKILSILNSYHRDIQFTLTKEESEQIAFLDVLVKRQAKSFVTTVYRKPTYT